MIDEYAHPISCLLHLITKSLNPHRDHGVGLTSKENISDPIIQIEKACAKLKTYLYVKSFEIDDEDELRVIIKKHQHALIYLYEYAVENQFVIEVNPNENSFSKRVLDKIEDLFQFIEVHFSAYLTLDQKVLPTYLSSAKQELEKLIYLIKQRPITKDHAFSYALDIVIQRMSSFIEKSEYPYEVTFKIIRYKKQLLHAIQRADLFANTSGSFSPIEEILIYFNYNSKRFIDKLTARLANEINSQELPIDRMDRILFYYKAFNQLHRKPNVKLNPNYHDISVVLSNWFMQEIFYLEKKIRLAVIPLHHRYNNERDETRNNEGKQMQKLLCMLSTDQIALILRAADDLRIVHAKSLTEVFRTIAPHLSTPYKENISHEAMRSKAYSPEERDRQIAIETLERIIQRIREY
ncbi:hypothetical protein [Sphingobacterium cellulitidis]|uniref:hypothetical protein n=1 Tax=Sphingobacterium cellulitidis TaxID=1768011 RepID=UPI000B941D2C|nr:hypothetical protein CHT99_07705 [Sphingobacterium cellulitidis]